MTGRASGASQQRSETFTGTTWMDPVLPTTDGTTVNNVFFPPGTCTHWHSHERGQLLVVTAGSGLVCAHGGQPHEIGAGDVVWVPPGERHWHGAGDGSYLLHLAVSLGSTGWFDPVAPEDHAAAAVPRTDRA